MTRKHRRTRADEVFIALAAMLLVWWPDPHTGAYELAFAQWNFVAVSGGFLYIIGFAIDRYTRAYGKLFRTLGALVCAALWGATSTAFLSATPGEHYGPLYGLLCCYTIYSLFLTHRDLFGLRKDDRGSDS